MDATARRSCLYFGRVMHQRVRPIRHRLDYRVFSLFVDLDELPALGRGTRLFSHNRFNLFSFVDRDHGPRDGSPLRPWIDRLLTDAGVSLDGGSVRLLCFPRLLGYVFNPLSVWYCYHADGSLRAVLYEVSNTFGEHHSYLIPVAEGRTPGAPVHQSCDKRFYVSPFIGMEARYRFRLTPPGDKLALVIRQSEGREETLLACHTGRREVFGDAGLLRAFVRFPLMTLKIVAAIHWEAIRLWRKGALYRARPEAPAETVTIISNNRASPSLATPAE